MTNFTTTNPTATGEPTETSDLTTLADNNSNLREHQEAQHVFVGAGYSSGKHFHLYYKTYKGNGSLSAGAAETNLFSQSDADFANGMWQAIIVFEACAFTFRWSLGEPSYTIYGVYEDMDHSGFLARPAAAGTKYSSGVPANNYVKFDWNTGTNTLTLAAKPPAGTAAAYTYAVWKISGS